MIDLVIASNNPHKLKEIKQIFFHSQLPINLKNLQDIGCFEDIAETQGTIEGNASLKSSYVSNKYFMNCFSDDSGLEVEVLNGAPGVYSARFAGEQKDDLDNCLLLLKKLSGNDNRSAQFKTIISLLWNGSEYLFEGIVKGTISTEMKGNNGFGYDPLFIPTGYTKTFAQMSEVEKNTLSHRGIAVKELVQFFKQVL